MFHQNLFFITFESYKPPGSTIELFRQIWALLGLTLRNNQKQPANMAAWSMSKYNMICLRNTYASIFLKWDTWQIAYILAVKQYQEKMTLKKITKRMFKQRLKEEYYLKSCSSNKTLLVLFNLPSFYQSLTSLRSKKHVLWLWVLASLWQRTEELRLLVIRYPDHIQVVLVFSVHLDFKSIQGLLTFKKKLF